jgi:hypothetical protein
MNLHNCKKCFHHLDSSPGQVVCRFWGGSYNRAIKSNGSLSTVISCPRKSL